jgi:hypothetical protein
VGTPKITRGSATRDFFRCPTRENNFFRLSSYCTVIPHYYFDEMRSSFNLATAPAAVQKKTMKLKSSLKHYKYVFSKMFKKVKS